MKTILNFIAPILISYTIYNAGKITEKHKCQKEIYGNYL